jgi:demethylmenaquinone methyltransferase/2-methoxy-6-polyprenyl-1,4-benzoquinol methylase
MPDHFGILAPIYDKVIRPKSPEEIISLAGLPVDGALLDAGGGTGRISQFLDGQVGRIVIADLSLNMLKVAGQKKMLSPVCASTESLPFPEGYFDRVIMVDALHHVRDQQMTADELWRVLKPGGRLLLEEPDIRTLTVKLAALAEKIVLMRSHFLNPEEIASLFPSPPARIEVVENIYIAWIIVDKD